MKPYTIAAISFLLNLASTNRALAQENKNIFTSVGAAQVTCFENAQELAQSEALKHANEACRIMTGSSAQILSYKTLEYYHGSCWIGAPSGAAVSVTYYCE